MKLTDTQRYLAERAWERLDVSGLDIVELDNPPFEVKGMSYNEKYVDFEV